MRPSFAPSVHSARTMRSVNAFEVPGAPPLRPRAARQQRPRRTPAELRAGPGRRAASEG